ncbi:hypothetical protein FOB84_16660 [Gordonia bronchialis]|uniref:hypothetical protein n=1 Tax=Gordonia bronchialis TaxID=2054 RepID=UPI0011C02143|nr:hypothetical protein [Gordonia bronchialis]MCC3323498.1 hypothetical protein [Gordonia bronchialis]QGS25525.1 hypothetical protein FOB84_16660 [Gordonia bronchialis]
MTRVIGPTVVRWEYSAMMDALEMASSYCMDVLSLPTKETRTDQVADAAGAVDAVLASASTNFEISHRKSGEPLKQWDVNPISGRTNLMAGLYDCGISTVRADETGTEFFAAIAIPVMGRIYGTDGTTVIKRTRDSSTGHMIERIFQKPATDVVSGSNSGIDGVNLATGSYVYDAVFVFEGRSGAIGSAPESPVDKRAVDFLMRAMSRS